MKVLLRHNGVMGCSKGLSTIMATVLLIGMTAVFTGVFAIYISRFGVSASAPSVYISIDKQTPSSNVETEYRISHIGGDTLVGNDIKISFEAYLGGRENPDAEFVSGEIVNLGGNPSINWDVAPTVTSVSLDVEYFDHLDAGEDWSLVFRVGSSIYQLDLTRLAIVDIGSGSVVFLAQDIGGT